MHVELQRVDEVAVVRLKGGRANAMSAALLRELESTFADLSRSDVSAVVLTGQGKAFSAGLALPDLTGLDRNAMREFITVFERAMQRVLSYPRATVAMVNGHAIAGGCVLALMCDVRLCADGPAKLGLNEVQLGIGLPSLVLEPLRVRVPVEALFPIAYQGRLLSVAEAAAVGLVNEVVAAAELEARAVATARALGRSPLAYGQIKQGLLRPVLEAITRNAVADREAWLDTWFSAHAQQLLREAVERLNTKR